MVIVIKATRPSMERLDTGLDQSQSTGQQSFPVHAAIPPQGGEDNEGLYDEYLSNTPVFQAKLPCDFRKALFKYNFSPFFPSDKGSRLLDIGPGRGEMLLLWRELGYVHIKGVDISREVVEFCRSTLGERVDLTDDLSQYLAEHVEAFDLITLIDVIEHLSAEELIPVGRAIYSSLKAGGRLIVQTCNAASPSALLSRYFDLTHQRSFTEESLSQWLKTAGFKTYRFFPTEEPIASLKGEVRKWLRSIYYSLIRFCRLLEHAYNPKS